MPALPWLLAGFAAAFGAARLPAAALDNYLRAIALASVICALWPLAEESARALPDVTELTAAPIPVVQPYRTRSGSIVSVPVSGTCWDAPPPCTIAPRADLTERVVGAPASGYRIEAGP